MAGKKKRRTPPQTIAAYGSLLAGVWLCLMVADWFRSGDLEELAERLPDVEVVNLSREELIERLGRDDGSVPADAEDISQRLYAVYRDADGAADNSFSNYLRMRVGPAVLSSDRYAVLQRPGRRRPLADQPPAWFPVEPDQASPWRTPSWWQPSPGGVAVSNARQVQGVWHGEYLHYDPASRYLHVWAWRRHGLTPPVSPLQFQVADLVAQELGRVLANQQHPVSPDGWLRAPGQDPDLLAGDVSRRPAGLTTVHACLLPVQERYRYLLGFVGVSATEASQLIAEVPMRELAPDGLPPDWPFALPVDGDQPTLPSWFAPGAGPRWGYALCQPGDGVVERARWAAYDEVNKTLYVWDWADLENPRPAEADPTR